MSQSDQEFLVQKIRSQYTQKEHSRVEALKKLDNQVKRPANVFAWTFGTIGAIIMGAGMSLIMTDLGAVIGLSGTMIPGIAVGILGMAMVIANYPIYQRILSSRRKRYAAEIIALSDSLME